MTKHIFLVFWVCLIFVFSGDIHAEADQYKKTYREGQYKEDRYSQSNTQKQYKDESSRDRGKKGRYSQPNRQKQFKDEPSRDRGKKGRYSQPNRQKQPVLRPWRGDRSRTTGKDGTYSERQTPRKDPYEAPPPSHGAHDSLAGCRQMCSDSFGYCLGRMDEDQILPDSPDYNSRFEECADEKSECRDDCLKEYHPSTHWGSTPGQEEPPVEDAKPRKPSWDRDKKGRYNQPNRTSGYLDLADLVVWMRRKTTLADKQEELQLRRKSLSQQDYIRFLNGVLYDRTASRFRANAEGAQLEEIALAIAYADQEARIFANYESNDVGSINVASVVYLYHYAKRAAEPSPYSYSERSSEPGEPLLPTFRYTPEFDLEHLGSLKSQDFFDLNTRELNNLIELVGEEVIRGAADNVGQEIQELLDSIGQLEGLVDSFKHGIDPVTAGAIILGGGALIYLGSKAIDYVFGDNDGDGQQNWLDPDDDNDGVLDKEDCCPWDPNFSITAETEGPGSVGFPFPLFRFVPGGNSR